MREEMHEALSRAARENRRSLSAEMEHRLTQPIEEDRIIKAVNRIMSDGIGQMINVALEALTPPEAKVHRAQITPRG